MASAVRRILRRVDGPARDSSLGDRLPVPGPHPTHPEVQVVLGAKDELRRSENPYQGYDTSGDPFLFKGEVDDRLPAFVRVAGVTFGGTSKAWSYDVLRRQRAIDATVAGQPLVLLWAAGSASPLEADNLREDRDVGSTGVDDPRVGGRTRTFAPSGRSGFRDRQTGSRWTLTGRQWTAR